MGLSSPHKSMNYYKYQFEAITLNPETPINQEERNFHWQHESKEIDCCDLALNQDTYLVMIKIKGDRFIMGTSDQEIGRNEDETPQHSVMIEDFLVSQYPITQKQYQQVMNDNPSIFRGENRPVENVSWYQAQDFCTKASQITGKNIRLLSEAEWEYVCRAGTNTPFYFGSTITSDLANYKACFGYGEGESGQWLEETTEVGKFPPNNFGLYDLHGNVWEWCEDHWHKNYQNAPESGKCWLEKNHNPESDNLPRVIRGGSWDDTAYYCRCGVRLWALPHFKGKLIGFRVACDIAFPGQGAMFKGQR